AAWHLEHRSEPILYEAASSRRFAAAGRHSLLDYADGYVRRAVLLIAGSRGLAQCLDILLLADGGIGCGRHFQFPTVLALGERQLGTCHLGWQLGKFDFHWAVVASPARHANLDLDLLALLEHQSWRFHHQGERRTNGQLRRRSIGVNFLVINLAL